MKLRLEDRDPVRGRRFAVRMWGGMVVMRYHAVHVGSCEMRQRCRWVMMVMIMPRMMMVYKVISRQQVSLQIQLVQLLAGTHDDGDVVEQQKS